MTEGGPSWKPLPILFTAPFSLFGQDMAPYLWLWVARAGGLFGCVMAYRMASRLIGGRRVRGARRRVRASPRCSRATSSCATPRSATPSRCWPRSCCGPSSATSTAAATTRSTSASPAALLRPEAWPFLGLYGLWLWFAEPRLRLRLVVLRACSIPALWFLPEWWGSGDPLRAGARANAPNPGSAAFADIPAVELLKRFVRSRSRPVELGHARSPVGYAACSGCGAGAEAATLGAARSAASPGSLLVAVMTEAGFAGNQRYLIVTTAVVCVLGGMGAVRVLQGVEWLARASFGTRARAALIAAGALLVGVLAALAARSSPRPTTRRACAAGSSTRPTSGTTSRG